MRALSLALLVFALPLSSAMAYDGEEYPEQGQYQEEVYQDESYQDESYPEETYSDDAYQEEPYHDDANADESAPADPAYQDPDAAAQLQEIRAMCQQYASELPPEEQGDYIGQCVQGQGY